MSRNRQLTAGKSHYAQRGYSDEKLYKSTTIWYPDGRMMKAFRKRNFHTITRNVKLYCDYRHNGLSFKQLAIKYHIKEKTAQNAYYKIKEKIERWKSQNKSEVTLKERLRYGYDV